MKKNYSVILVLLCLCQAALAQSISINYINEACIGSVQRISVSTNGAFNGDNKFTVQVREQNDTKIISELPAVLKDGSIEVVHSDTLVTYRSNLVLRVVTSSPKSESNWAPFKINKRGYIELTSADSDTINFGADIKIKLLTISDSHVNITLNDSTRHSVSSYLSQAYITTLSTPTNGNDPVFIAHAENQCGAMTVRGLIKPVVNAAALRPIATTPAAVCLDGEIKVSFSAQGTPFSSQTKYRLRFKEELYYTDQKTPRQAEVTAVIKDNVLVAQIPKSLNITSRTAVRVQIVTEHPSSVSSLSDFILYVHPKASVEFTSSSGTINIGDNFYANVTFSGLPPFSAEMQDGQTFSSTSEGSAYIYLRPEKTTSYNIKSFSSGCGQTTEPGNQTMVVTVNPGVIIPSPQVRQVVCQGSTFRLPFLSNFDYNASTRYFVNMYLSGEDGNPLTISATRNGGFMEFALPTHYANGIEIDYDTFYGISIRTESPASLSSTSHYNFVVQSKPDVRPGQNFDYFAPGNQYVYINLKGRGPMVLEDWNGQKYNTDDNSWNTRVFLRESMDLKIKSISNACFSNNNIAPIRLNLNNSNLTTGVYVEQPAVSICQRDSVEISFMTTGNFNDGNVFNIQGYLDCCNYQTLAVVKSGGKYKVKLPSNALTYAQFRVASSNPVFFSDQISIQFQQKPGNFYLYPQGTSSSPYISSDEEVYISLSNSGGNLTSLVYTDGTSDVNAPIDAYQQRVKVSPPLGVMTTYTIKSATNMCGTEPVNQSVSIKKIPYNISPIYIDYENTSFCPGVPFSVPFTVSKSNATNSKFSLELIKEGSSDIITLAKDQITRQFNVTVPNDLAAGYYFLRIVSSDGGVSENRMIRIGALPTAVLSSDMPHPVTIESGQSVNLKTTFTGSAPWMLVYQNGLRHGTSSSPTNHYIQPTKSGDYELQTVYNSCGYGTVSGKVSVKVKPSIAISSDSYSVCQGATFNVTYALRGDAELGSDYIRFELVDSGNQKVIVLDSTKTLSGRKTLNIPAVLSGSYYSVRATVKSLGVNSVLSVNVSTKADLSIGGNSIINPGERTTVIIKNKKVNAPEIINFRLSDGTSGQIYGSQFYYADVSPTQNTTYTLVSASNGCGEGFMSGSASVEVNPASSRTVTVTGTDASGGTCIGDTILVQYETKGSFSAGNTFTVQVSDTTGKNYRSIFTSGSSSPLKAVIPADIYAGKNYRLRILASDPNTGSGTNRYPSVFNHRATARFASESVLYNGVTNPKIVVLLEGGTQWQYQYGTDLNVFNRYTTNASDTITLFQASPSQYYKLFKVWNSCGAGTIGTPATVRVEVITGEPLPDQMTVTVGPNPAQDFVNIKFDSPKRRNLVLFNMQGVSINSFQSGKAEENIDVSKLASGIYILQIEAQGRKNTFKIIKQ
ncbi:T9SS type A sorting domain-containing protein [Dyadobacter sp. CY312]|uniref:T9SS type A sorting domain-containing protein n=1 Tax=Dyadobacter sp. CY312 TaxID=2907303 RepID=UPI001F331C51|nr:T9SS type A sorting domain-containing protein [Dyadobacter sp. CY312]MCE7041736.1 T9SS type A sorting domain-containing protein [Dyadobacter sp. CY312]